MASQKQKKMAWIQKDKQKRQQHKIEIFAAQFHQFIMRPALRHPAALHLYKEKGKDTKTHTVGGRTAWPQIEKQKGRDSDRHRLISSIHHTSRPPTPGLLSPKNRKKEDANTHTVDWLHRRFIYKEYTFKRKKTETAATQDSDSHRPISSVHHAFHVPPRGRPSPKNRHKQHTPQ